MLLTQRTALITGAASPRGLGHGAADDSQVIRAYRALNGAHAANDS